MTPWRFRVAPRLGMPTSDTLSRSYLSADRHVFEIEKLVTDGLARLRQNAADEDAAILVAEALRRILSEADRQHRWNELTKSGFTRLVDRFTKGWLSRQLYENTPRELYLSELGSMAMGVLVHYGWADYAKLAHRWSRTLGDDDGFAVVTTAARSAEATPIEQRATDGTLSDTFSLKRWAIGASGSPPCARRALRVGFHQGYRWYNARATDSTAGRMMRILARAPQERHPVRESQDGRSGLECSQHSDERRSPA